ncbi:asparagine synthase (glutamine-hydrolyzing) [Aquella oligotrophica]|uniref:asparagine synthase (glutamine-hydrolyzing) n=1 Tax=Aquella oligotrophica TaxID=2067065 RepID=A0A2I7N9L2_9NEIS|nr:asparagine synthase (glutamine-hydrolyzing) [Aquella oligotrophica]AUR53121.1 asparagine synthase (glutamine-hydrolyzing) [Aquella oligotrophica]
MCGIAGFIDKNPNYEFQSIATKMGSSIWHRGPDAYGHWIDNNFGVNLIHQRLSILDLSDAGKQPMLSDSGRYIITFNGEIYNHNNLRKEYEQQFGSHIWRGHSDTEIILAYFDRLGIEAALAKFEGMFAIAVWDKEEKALCLIRDRIGEKPLYYGYIEDTFIFASELKAIRAHPKFVATINHDSIAQLLLHNCIPAPLSIYNGIYKLEPGRMIKLEYSQYQSHTLPKSKQYWQLLSFLSIPYNESFATSSDKLESLLLSVIDQQMMADVPVGCFLSGGVDSSLISALMQKQASKPIETFSIGFDHPDYNEAHYAKEVARHLGTSHNELYVTDQDALNIILDIPFIYDEPFADSSQIPTILVSKLAKSKVTVALSGDGGDELFGGYNRYLLAQKLFNKVSRIPSFLRPKTAQLLNLLSPQLVGKIEKLIKFPVSNLSDKLYKLSGAFKAKTFDDLYLVILAHWLDPSIVMKTNISANSLWLKDNDIRDNLLKMQYLDAVGYLPDDIMTKVDRAAMSVSLETRAPLLNHKIVEFAFTLPEKYKINNGVSKCILRDILYRHVPKELIERPKKGFGIPINQWLRSELKDWAGDLLNPAKINSQGIFNGQVINQKLTDHLAGKANNGYYLWDILMFQQWNEYYKVV